MPPLFNFIFLGKINIIYAWRLLTYETQSSIQEMSFILPVLALHIEHSGFTCILPLYKVYTHIYIYIYIYTEWIAMVTLFNI